MKAKIILIILIINTLILCLGCSNNIRKPSTDIKTIKLDSNIYEIPTKPNRVILLTSTLTELWIDAGGIESIVACPLSGKIDKNKQKMLKPLVMDVGVSTSLNAETILNCAPDIVIGLSNYKQNENVKGIIQKSGINYLEVKNDNLNDNFHIFKLFSIILGNEKYAQDIINQQKKAISTNQEKNRNKTIPKVLMIWGTTNHMLMVTPKSRHGELIFLAGGKNIIQNTQADQELLPISIEYIIENQPDIILFSNHGDQQKINQMIQKQLLENPSWKNLKAVKKNNIFVLPENIFPINPGLKSVDAIIYLSNIFYK